MNPRQAVEFVVREFEGGLSDHPDDRGGLTNQGLTWEVFLEERPHGTREAFIALTRDDVIEILTERYALKPGYARIVNPEVRLAVIDYAINSHWTQATKSLQRAIGVHADGVFGPQTEDAVNRANPDRLLRKFAGERLALWVQIFINRPKQRTFAPSWCHRLAVLLQREPA